MYSTIEKKKCKCGCNRYPTMSCFGYNYNCLPPDLKEKAGTRRKVQIKNKNIRTAITYKLRKEQRKIDGSEQMDIWFLLRRYEMTGKCVECGAKTNKDYDDYFRWSICHIAPKKLVPSVATHPENWIELCWQHHSELDASFERAIKLKCFPEIKRKFELFKHLIPNDELHKINPHLLTL